MDFSVQSFKDNLVQTTAQDFEAKALALFQYQARENAVYKRYLEALRVLPTDVQSLTQIPFLPIECFKHHAVLVGKPTVEKIFESSGTTGQKTSQHHITDLAFYEQVSIFAFEQVYGALENYHILALLPSYLERDTSSLVYMVQAFMRKSQSAHAGFFLQNMTELLETMARLRQQNDRKILLIGVTFALLDLVEQYAPDLSDILVMETGGMKGRRKELIREELHAILWQKAQVKNVHAEYGMTELRSQAYSVGEGLFSLPAWCKILLRDVNDPRDYAISRTSGVINFIDLANVDSCAFIATQDIATRSSPTSFKILGRVDNSDIRGCNLLMY